MSERAERVEAIRERQTEWLNSSTARSLDTFNLINEDMEWLLAEIDRLREERERLRDALDEPGPSTEEIKARARVLLTDQGASPSNLAYLAARMEWRLKRAHRALTDSEESGDE